MSLFLALTQAVGSELPRHHPPLMERGSGGEARPLIVAPDGSGDFTTVQAAVDAVPAENSHPVTIRIKPGVYRERITIPRNKPHIALIGEDAQRTVLTYSLNAHSPGPDGREIGTFNSASTFVFGDDFSAENVTFENTAGNHGQALAIHVAADRTVFRRCRFLGWQDTVLLNRGRQYFADCTIAGHVDFIFGAATAFFERCEIHCLARGYITAASTPESQPYGFVFSHCRITADSGAGTVALGRPWRPFASVAFLDTEMPAAIRPEGWDNWRDPSREKTARYAEFGSTGPGAAPAARAGWSRPLTESEAKALTPEKVLGGSDGWNPAASRSGAHSEQPSPRRPTLFIIGDSTVNNHTAGQLGWGDPIAAHFDPAKIKVENRARGGRSSRTFLTEGLWDQVLASIQPGDFVLMQFGHNDGGPLTGGRARASLKGNGDEVQEVVDAAGKKEQVHTYGWYLRKYIADARARGATPIVLSPIPRNIWNNGKVARASNDYGKWAAEAAKAGGAYFVDLNEIIAKHYEEAGREKVQAAYFGPTDHTHTTPAGAALNAASVVEGLKALKDCPLRSYLTPAASERPGAP